MGASQSITKQVNKTVQETEEKEACNCSSVVYNHIGDINLSYGPCCIGTNLTIDQNAHAKCDCSMSMAIDSLSKQANKMSNEAKSSLSLAVSTQQGNMTDEEFVKTALTATCNSSSSATNYIKQINETLANCCDMTDEEIHEFSKVKQTISQTGSVQGQCLMSLAAKVEANMSSKDTASASTTDPLNYAISTISSHAVYYIIGAVVIAGIYFLSRLASNKKGEHEYDHEGEYGDERCETSLIAKALLNSAYAPKRT